MARSTINDVAERARVSIKTVSRVVNREPNVRQSTRDRVEKAIAELNYHPNPSARNLASQRARLIGLIYDDPSAYEIPSAGYVIRMQQGSLSACRAANFELLIHPCIYRHEGVAAELREFVETARPAGIILAAPLSNMPKIVRAIGATGTPLVRLSPGSAATKQYTISTNDREISAEMTRHLASLGHAEIAFISGHPSHKAVGRRLEGFRDGLEQSGLGFSDRRVVQGDNSFRSGEACGRRLLRRKRRPTAIFAANDDMAAGVIRVAGQLGIRIPEELSVAGCDDIALAQQVYPELTTIRQPLSKMAEHAATSLIRATQSGETLSGHEVIPASLVLRDSTGPAPTGPARPVTD